MVVARIDDVDRDALRDLAVAVRDQPGVRAVVIGGAPASGGAAIVSAVEKDSGLHAAELIADTRPRPSRVVAARTTPRQWRVARIPRGSTPRWIRPGRPRVWGRVRALGLDLGNRRIGLAISDSDGRVATPIGTLHRAKGRDHAADHRAIAELVAEWEAGVVAVGLPLSLDGSIGPAAQAVLDEVAELARALDVPVETVG